MTSKLLQENDLTEGTLCVGSILEGVKILLQGNNFLGALVNSFPNDTVSTLTYNQTDKERRG